MVPYGHDIQVRVSLVVRCISTGIFNGRTHGSYMRGKHSFCIGTVYDHYTLCSKGKDSKPPSWSLQSAVMMIDDLGVINCLPKT